MLSLQEADGHWCGELEGDAILEAEYMLTMFYLGRHGDRRFGKAALRLRDRQLPSGGWSLFPGGGANVNPTVKAYFALKLAGDAADLPHMESARRAALELGGLDACNSFTKIYLAIFGQYPWSQCPAVPPELVLLPRWLPFNIYGMSAWSRAIVVPLSIVRALRPSCPLPPETGIGELRLEGAPAGVPAAGSLAAAAWHRLFRLTDGVFRLYERRPLRGLRRRALEAARDWTVRRFEGSDGLGAIFPPIVNSIFALRALGVESDDPLSSGADRRARETRDRRRDDLCGSSPASPRCGTRRWLSARFSTPGSPGIRRRSSERLAGSRIARCGSSGTGRAGSTRPRRRAGTSSTPTSSTRTATTLRRS